MNKKLIYILLFLPLFASGQYNFFWSHTYMATIPCDEETQYDGGQSYPTTININLGTGVGDVYIWFWAEDLPDNFYVYYDGELKYGSNYRGHPSFSYDVEGDEPGDNRQDFIDALEGKIDPQWGTTYPDFTHYPWDGYNLIYSDESTDWVFTKTSSTPTIATVKIYAPMPGTFWHFILYCPE